MLAKLLNGEGDIAVANLTVTAERRKLADFSDPFFRNVKELLVTGKATRIRNGLHDLAGINIAVRKSSSYYESIQRVNRELAVSGKAPIEVSLVGEYLEDEDLLEMINAGHLQALVIDSHKAEFWIKVFKNIQIHSSVIFRDDGEISWMFRKGSPKLKSKVNSFVLRANPERCSETYYHDVTIPMSNGWDMLMQRKT